MSCRKRRAHRKERYDSEGVPRKPSVIRRVTGGVADRLGLSRKFVVIAFIIGLILNLPLALLAFGIAWWIVDRPDNLEEKLDKAARKARQGFEELKEKTASATAGTGPAYAGAAAGAGTATLDEEFDFSELRRKFDDLERRAGDMERHVASDEYDLDKKFRDM